MFYPLLFEICFHLVGNVSFGDGSQIDAGFGIFQCNGVILNVDLCVINVAYGLGNGIGRGTVGLSALKSQRADTGSMVRSKAPPESSL